MSQLKIKNPKFYSNIIIKRSFKDLSIILSEENIQRICLFLKHQYNLTRSEQFVVSLKIQVSFTKDIATILKVKEKSVKFHLTNSRKKMKIDPYHNITLGFIWKIPQAYRVLKCEESKIIPPPPENVVEKKLYPPIAKTAHSNPPETLPFGSEVCKKTYP